MRRLALCLLMGATVLPARAHAQAHLVINEIMYAPTTPEPEWIELYNAGDTPLDLRGTTLTDLTTTANLTGYVLPPGEYVVLTKDPIGLRSSRTGNFPVLSCTLPSLNNTGDKVVLRDTNGVTLDSIAYLQSWGGSQGRSLERRDPAGASTIASNWGTSTAGATPGSKNSLPPLNAGKPGEVVINEVLFAPLPGKPEWIELLNPTDSAHVLTGWTVTIGKTARALPQGTIGPHDYVVLAASDSALHTVYGIDHNSLQVALPALPNAGSAIALHDALGNLIDSIIYDGRWAGAGRSLERLDESYTGLDSTNWSECVDPSGTTVLHENSLHTRQRDLSILRSSSEDTLLHVTIRNAGRSAADSLELTLLRDGFAPVVLKAYVHIEPRDQTALSFNEPRDFYGIIAAHLALSGSDDRSSNDTSQVTISRPIPAGTVAINEILYQPRLGNSEWIEFYATATVPVSISGCIVQHASAALHSFGPLLLQPNDYCVLAANSSFFVEYPELLPWSTGMDRRIELANTPTLGLSNSGGDLVVASASGETIDSVYYSPESISPLVADPTGISLERVTPSSPGTARASWKSSSEPSGSTPLKKNSIRSRTDVTGSGPWSATFDHNPFSPNGDEQDLVTTLTIETGDDHTYACRVRLYDQHGRFERTLSDNILVQQHAAIAFTGKSPNGTPLPTGLYTVLIELSDPTTSRLLTKKIGLAIAPRR